MKFEKGEQVLCVRDMPVSPLYPRKGDIVTVDDYYPMAGLVLLKGYGFLGRYQRVAFPSQCFEKVMSDRDLSRELAEILK